MIEKIAILKNPEHFFGTDIYVPEAREIEYIINGLAKLDVQGKLIPRADIWKICQSDKEAEKLMEEAEKIIKAHTDKAKNICNEIARNIETELKALIG